MSERNDVTTGEIMDFLKDHMVTREEFGVLKAEVGGLKEEVGGLKEEVGGLKAEIAVEFRKMKVEILDGVDDKITNLKGDLVVLMRKEDRKVITLIGMLREKQVISEAEAKALLGMEPFPQILSM